MSFDRESDGSDHESEFMVPAVLARSMVEAEVYCELLGDHDIPAIIGDGPCDVEIADDDEDIPLRSPGMTRGVPVLVPEILLDDAGEIISRQEKLDEFDVVEESLNPHDGDADDDAGYGFTELDESDDDDLEDEDSLLDPDDLTDEDDEL